MTQVQQIHQAQSQNLPPGGVQDAIEAKDLPHLRRAQARLEDLWIRGVDFDETMVAEAKTGNRMLLLDLDFTGECKLHCYYCDRTPDRFNKVPNRRQLTTEERKSQILQAKALGATTIEFPGAGEPMIDTGFWEILEFIHEQGLISVVFTSGYHLDKEAVDRLYELEVSVFMKYNSANSAHQDKIVGIKGYGDIVTRSIEYMLEKGFSDHSPTRLAVDLMLSPRDNDIEEVETLFRWCRQNNIHNYIMTLIPEGRADRKIRILERQRADDLIERLCKIDREEFGLEYVPSRPMAGGYKCHQVNVGLFVNLFGEVYDCNGLGRIMGHTRRHSLEEIWNSKFAQRVRKPDQKGYCLLRERWWTGIETDGIDRKMQDYYRWEKKNGPDEVVIEGLDQRSSTDNATKNVIGIEALPGNKGFPILDP